MKRAILLLFLFLSFSLAAQEAGFITLHGEVSDKVTGEPLRLASVALGGTNVTNVTNAEGGFTLKIPSDTDPSSEVTVGYLGYVTTTLRVADFASASADRPLRISLIALSIKLDPAVIRSIDPDVLFNSAYFKVRENYPDKRVGMTAFYREMIRKGAGKYLVLNEAVVDLDKASYTGFGSDRAAIYKGRGSVNYDVSDSVLVSFQGGITTALQLDLVKNPFIGTTLEGAHNFYDFSLDETVNRDDLSFFVLSFKPKSNVNEIIARGRMYIETETLAIARFEFSLDIPEGREEEAADIFVVKKPAGRRFYTNSADYVVNFRYADGFWHYDYCLMTLDFSTRKKGSLFRTNFTVTGEMAVTDHSDTPVAIDASNRVKFKDILSRQVTSFTDDNFWEGYNIIEPDQSIDVIIRRIVRQLNRRSREE